MTSEAQAPYGQAVAGHAMTRRLHLTLFVVLLLLCPVFATDFIVSGGVVPIGYVLFYFLFLYPSWFVLAYWIVVPYAAIFYFISKLAARRIAETPLPWRHYVVAVLVGAIGLLSLLPVYRPIRHGADAWQDVISLFRDEHTLATRNRR